MQRYRFTFRGQTTLASVMLVALCCLTACSAFGTSTSTTTSATTTPAGSPTPTIPAGYYAFIRNGDVWARNGLAPAHPVTFLHLANNVATWGPLSWSPDRTMLAFVLRAPPFAPPSAASTPSQDRGTLFLVNLATGSITSLHGASGGVIAPLLGQHIAWVDNTTLLFTQDGTVEQATLGATITIAPLAGPKSVWEIAIRAGTLFYSTLANITPAGTGSAELHSFVLAGSDHHDQTLATLGPATLPAATICGLVCVPDTATPYVPFAWAVSADGTQIAYQQAASGVVASPTAVPATTTTPGTTATPTPPVATSHVLLAHADGTQPQPIFAQSSLPTGQVALAFAPNGQHIALAAASPGSALYPPTIQAVGTGSASQPPATITPSGVSQVTLSGPITWTPDSNGISVTQNTLPPQTTTAAAITFTLTNQSALTEQAATDFGWAS